LIESLHFDIQSTGQKSQTATIRFELLSVCFVLIKQSNSPGICQFSNNSLLYSAGKPQARPRFTAWRRPSTGCTV